MKSKIQNLFSLVLLTFSLSLLLSACSLDRTATEQRWLVLVTTQELESSGLLDALLPPYEQATGVKVKRLPLGTAKALAYADKAGVDVLLLPAGLAFDKLAGATPTYPPYQAKPFPTPTPGNLAYPTARPEDGEAAPQPPGFLFNERRVALWSELVLVTPTSDPLRLPEANQEFAAKTFKLIALTNTKLYAPSQAYEPGLYQASKRIWNQIGAFDLKDRGAGFRQFDGDINTVLRQAAEDGAYVLAPLASFVASGTSGKLKAFAFPADAATYLPYELALPNNIGSQDRDVKLARTLAAYLTGTQAQEIIAKHTKGGFPNPPFRPHYFPVYVPSGS